MGESGWSAEQRAKELRARGKSSAGAWEAGADGERRVAQALTALPPEWLVLHDRLLMPGRSEANLDHVVVGPAGVFLIDSKNWAGTISEYQGSVFKHSGGPGKRAAARPAGSSVRRRVPHGHGDGAPDPGRRHGGHRPVWQTRR